MTAAMPQFSQSELERQAVTLQHHHHQQQQQPDHQQAKQQQWTPQQQHFMSLAFEQARQALKVREVPIGCVVVRDGQVIGTGYNMTNHTRNATRHAEMEAIDRILADHGGDLAKAGFSRCELYVTIEPCIMCAGALSLMGFRHVYYGAGNDKFGGCGSILSIHQDGCEPCSGRPDYSRPAQPFTATGGLFADEAISLLQTFYTAGNPAAPKPHRPVMEVPPWEHSNSDVPLPQQQEQQQQQHEQPQGQQQQPLQERIQQKLQQPRQQQQHKQPPVGWEPADAGTVGQAGADGSDKLQEQYAS